MFGQSSASHILLLGTPLCYLLKTVYVAVILSLKGRANKSDILHLLIYFYLKLAAARPAFGLGFKYEILK
jgi:hypothetical protein